MLSRAGVPRGRCSVARRIRCAPVAQRGTKPAPSAWRGGRGRAARRGSGQTFPGSGQTFPGRPPVPAPRGAPRRPPHPVPSPGAAGTHRGRGGQRAALRGRRRCCCSRRGGGAAPAPPTPAAGRARRAEGGGDRDGWREEGWREGGREEGAAAPQLFSASPPRLPHVTAGNSHGPCRPRESSLPPSRPPPSLPVLPACPSVLRAVGGLPQTVWLVRINSPGCLLQRRAFLTPRTERGESRFCFLLELHCEIWLLML